ncbi:MAG: signal peptidase I [Tepidanaerobacteraceae bacterium]|jgi:signal peptidase
MKLLFRILGIGAYIVIIILLAAAVGSAITRQPLLMSAVRSNSMYPLFKRGDAVFIEKLAAKDVVEKGDIVIFKTESGSYASQGWIMHRVVDGDTDTGFITKGDANEMTDQQTGGSGPIKREWIVSRSITWGSIPLKLPLIGYIPLYMEKFQKNPYTLPTIAVILAAIVGASGLTRDKKNKKSGFDLQLVYLFSGITVVIVIAATMLATSQHLVIQYEVTQGKKGIIMGSDIGILQVGESIEKPLVELSNKGFVPIIATITNEDTQLSFNHDRCFIRPGEQREVVVNVTAEKPGEYRTPIWVGMFFPILPIDILYRLARINYWLALFIVSIVPGLPIMLYPLIDTRLRKKTIRQIRRKLRRLLTVLNNMV